MRRGVRAVELRMGLFKLHQLLHQHVIFIVADTGAVFYIISAVVLQKQAPELIYPVFIIHFHKSYKINENILYLRLFSKN